MAARSPIVRNVFLILEVFATLVLIFVMLLLLLYWINIILWFDDILLKYFFGVIFDLSSICRMFSFDFHFLLKKIILFYSQTCVYIFSIQCCILFDENCGCCFFF